MRYTLLSRLPRAIVASTLAVAISATLSFTVPTAAHAAPRAKTISRAQVMKRAKSWVKARVPYSQSRTRGGYRQDCSGFVSMSWALGRSYTTRTLPSVSRRIKTWQLKPGDAVVSPGHAVIFGGWKNRKARTFYAYEEPTWGKVATKRVRTLKPGSKALRRPGIREAKPVVKKKAPVRRPAAPVAILPLVKAGEKPVATAVVVSVASTTSAMTAPAVSSVATPTP